MRNIKLIIEYDGTDFQGWQIQALGHRTVQGEIESALQTIFTKKISVCGSGRTDSGVHAAGQAANFKLSSSMPCDMLQRALNANLPSDIIILDVSDAAADFHARYSAKRKTYRYTILNRAHSCVLNRHFCTHIPFHLNMNAMRYAASQLVGQHDFKSFAASNPAKRGKKESTVREIYQAEFKKRGDYITFDIEGNGFLYKMVRNIVGTLIMIGSGKASQECIPEILNEKDRSYAGDTAPARGLCLMKVEY